MNNMQQGFTLIELMIVIAIIAILAAFALPAYGDYTKRTYVMEGTQLANVAKTAVIDFYSVNGIVPADNSAAGLVDPEFITGQGTRAVRIWGLNKDDGEPPVVRILINYTEKVANNAFLSMYLDTTPSAGSFRWACGRIDPTGEVFGEAGKLAASSNNTSKENVIPNTWLPSNCRG